MAAGDWSFPRSGCSCKIFTAQLAARRWIGARLPTPTNAGNSAFEFLYFLTYRQTNTQVVGVGRFGSNNLTPGDLTVDWSDAAATFGNFTATGNVGSGSFFPSLVNPQITQDRLTEIGEYLFQTTGTFQLSSDNGAPTPFALVSFVPGPLMIVTLRYSFTAITNSNGTQTYTMERRFSNHLSHERMADILLADMEQNRPYSIVSIPDNYPSIYGGQNPSQSAPLSDTSAYNVGGVFTIRRQRGGLLSIDDSLAFPNPDPTQTTVGHSLVNAHASRRLLATAEEPHKWALSACLGRSLIYQPGISSVQEFDITSGELISCEDTPIACPAESEDGELYIVQPPTVNNRRRTWRQDQAC